MTDINRRKFLGASLGAAASVASLTGRKNASAADKIVVGLMGCGGRGYVLADRTSRMPDVEIKYICDPDQRRYSGVAGVILENGRKRPEAVQDFRKMLDDPEVDAVINATQDYWHALSTIMACQAGKDVYVEKPLTQNIWEGRKMVEAARKYGRVVQVGTQSRSSAYLYKAAEYVRSGKLGDVHLVKIYNMLQLETPPDEAPTAVPDSINWDLWCGPAPLYPYRPSRRWYTELWDFSVGGIFADAIHQIDNARLIFDRKYPNSVYCLGSIVRPGGLREAPDTIAATYEYDGGLTVTIHGALWTPYMKKIPQEIRMSDSFPDFRFTSTKVEVYGTGGVMFFGRQGGGWMVYDDTWNVVASEYGRETTDEHLRNFFDCIASRQKPNCDIEEAHLDIIICHLANISYRLGNRKLRFDGAAERFVGDDEANALLKREYRKPWVIPESV